MHIGVYIKNKLDNPLYKLVSKTDVVVDPCSHYDEKTMLQMNFCFTCGRKFRKGTLLHHRSTIQGFEKSKWYVRNKQTDQEQKYYVSQYHSNHELCESYFVKVSQSIDEDNYVENAEFYIEKLKLAQEIAQELRDKGLDAVSGIYCYKVFNEDND